MSSTTQPTEIPFDPLTNPTEDIRKKFIEAWDQYKKNHPNKKAYKYIELEKVIDSISAGELVIRDINQSFVIGYNSRQVTSLKLAILLESKELVQYILSHGAQVNIKDLEGMEELYYAAEADNVEVVELLIAAGAAVDARNNFGCTPLHKAAKCGNTAVVEMLLRAGADPNIRDNGGDTPLHRCAYYGNIKIAEMLVEYGVDIGAKDCTGSTAIDNARINHPEIAEYLSSVKVEKQDQEGIKEEQSDSSEVVSEPNNKGIIEGIKEWWFSTSGAYPTEIIPFDAQGEEGGLKEKNIEPLGKVAPEGQGEN